MTERYPRNNRRPRRIVEYSTQHFGLAAMAFAAARDGLWFRPFSIGERHWSETDVRPA
ncbi:hypothetical protein [Azospirillum argentinense]